MTQGSIMRQVLIFALPICAGNVLQQLYGTVDTLVIGNFCGSVSLAAVGTSSQPVEMLLCIFLGLGTGVSILVSQFSGSGDGKSQREIVATAISFLYICAIPLAVIGQFAGPLVLKIMQVPPDTWDLANSYIRIIFIGTLGNMGYNMNAGILRGVGDSRASLLFLLVSCVVNIALDLLFVAGLGMDVAGAALATMLAMYCSWLFSVAYIRRQYPELGFTLLPKRLNRPASGAERFYLFCGTYSDAVPDQYAGLRIYCRLCGQQQGYRDCQCGNKLTVLSRHHLFRPESGGKELCIPEKRRAADPAVFRADYLYRRASCDILQQASFKSFYERSGSAGFCGALYPYCPSLHLDFCRL